LAEAVGVRLLFVGRWSVAEWARVLTRYVGSRPSGDDGAEAYKGSGARLLPGQDQVVVEAGSEDRARVLLASHDAFEGSWLERNHFYATLSILDVLLLEELRERLGGTYGVSASGRVYQEPFDEWLTYISFTCSPERIEELTDAARRVMKGMVEAPVDESYIIRQKEKSLRDRELRLQTNSFWLGGISGALQNGDDPHMILTWAERNNSLTPQIVQEPAARYLNSKNQLQGILVPNGE